MPSESGISSESFIWDSNAGGGKGCKESPIAERVAGLVPKKLAGIFN